MEKWSPKGWSDLPKAAQSGLVAGSGPRAPVLGVPSLSCCQALAPEQAQSSSPTALSSWDFFLRQVLTRDPKLHLNTGLWPLLLLYSFLPSGVGNPEWLFLCLRLLSGEKKIKKKPADSSPNTCAELHLLDSSLCWILPCLLSCV